MHCYFKYKNCILKNLTFRTLLIYFIYFILLNTILLNTRLYAILFYIYMINITSILKTYNKNIFNILTELTNCDK